jgi:hypothetical protein
MKKLTMLFALLFAASFAIAADSTTADKPAAAAKSEAKAPAAKTTTHEVTAEVVSADVTKKEITLKDDKGESHTAPVQGKAIASLKTVKAGEKVTVTCLDENGQHKAVTAIKPATAIDKKPASAPADKPASETKNEAK